jgi:hypothetical protein
VPTLARRQKQRARSAIPSAVRTFLAILNTGRVRIPGAGTFNSERWPTHERLRRDLVVVAQCFVWDNGRIGGADNSWLHDGRPRLNFQFLRWHEDTVLFPEELAQPSYVAMTRRVAAVQMRTLIEEYFQARRWAAFRCLAKCARADCGHWFFVMHNRSEYHSTQCSEIAKKRRQRTRERSPRRSLSR